MRFFSFSMLIAVGAVLGHLYLYRRLVRQLTATRPTWRRALGGLLLVMTALLVLRRTIRAIGPDVERAYELVAYSWIAVALSMVVAVAAGDLVRVVLWVVRRMRAKEPSRKPEPEDESSGEVDLARRALLSRAVSVGVLAGGGLTAGYGIARAFTPPEISEVAVRLPKLPRSLDGLTIVQLTDIHVGPFIRRGFIDMLVAEANALRPDLVVITGDLVDGGVRELGGAVAGLARLRSRYGTFFVTGNHEYYSGEVQWTRYLEQLGVSVLRNRRVEIGDAGGHLDLIGVDDWGGRRRGRQGYDLDAALAGRDPERAAVLLAHQPANFEVAAARGVDLQISGHTHGGQLFPMTLLVGLGWKYTRGLYRHDESHLYVSRGCGFWGPPARVGSPPEIAKITLTT